MENLLILLSKIQQVSPLSIFDTEVIVVQNAGMQHWLNLSLANMRGISMNINFSLPAQFLWKLLRELASDDDIPEQSPFEREVLSWRIYELLRQPLVIEDEDFAAVTHYWPDNREHGSSNVQATDYQEAKCYQLACQLADIYEQYLIFRPEWIDAWSQGEFVSDSTDDNFVITEVWQRKLWVLLTREISYSPLNLFKSATQNIEAKRDLLPKRISFFGINAMAPMWLKFIEVLGQFTQVHFFHLNPCFDYWGDIKTEKQAIRTLSNWTDGFDDMSVNVGNPLLANLGQQGREFLALLQDIATIDVNAFEEVDFDVNENDAVVNEVPILQSVQQDILQLKDQRETPTIHVDESIVVTSAHSALREVQGLHDWLLHQFNQDPTLTPKDVLVMCPAIEQYAPYVNAVFSPGWQDIDENIPPLPCSIADRVSKDAEPIVATFIELLQINTCRFEVSKIVSWLRLPNIRRKLALENEDIDRLVVWLDKANIHWGRDQFHKAELLANDKVSPQFTWHYGLQQLILGLAQSDQDALVGNQLFLADVEGTSAELLGNLMLMLDNLAVFSTSLHQQRTPSQWHAFFIQFIEDFFVVDDSQGFTIVFNAINDLLDFTENAKYQQKLPLSVVQEFLFTHFSQPDPGRQFMVGQVTFCSMLPMRSIPFKVVAVLGLNDGEYPRQRQPYGFDLMSSSESKLGDRSRRGDDRYLFLEAIISARRSLYLSYQGRNISNNAPREPSIVLKELMHYLTDGYGWQFALQDEQTTSQLRQLPMQPFSVTNYQGKWPSFDKKWLSLIAESERDRALPNIEQLATDSIDLTVDEIIRYYQHPSKWFANNQLRLILEDYGCELEDNEPFVEDSLQSYLFKQSLFQIYVDPNLDNEQKAQAISNEITKTSLSGSFPDLPTTQPVLEKWREDTDSFNEYINSTLESGIQSVRLTYEDSLTELESTVGFTLSGKLQVFGNKAAFFRMSSPKAGDFLRLYINQLLIQCVQENTAEHIDNQKDGSNFVYLRHVTSCHGLYFDTKNQKISHYCYAHIDNPLEKLKALISLFVQGMKQPLLINSALAEKALTAKQFEQQDFEKYWHDTNVFSPFGNDPYIKYFWPECPPIDSILPALERSFSDCVKHREQIKK